MRIKFGQSFQMEISLNDIYTLFVIGAEEKLWDMPQAFQIILKTTKDMVDKIVALVEEKVSDI